MKTKFYWSWKAVLVLAGLPIFAARLPGQSVPDGVTLTAPAEVPVAATNQPAAIAQPPSSTLPAMQLYGGTAEVVKLAQSGVGEGVLLNYITNTTARFGLGSDQIIYLNDLGVSSTVVAAMIQHDAAQGAAGTTLPPAIPAYPPDQTDLTAVPPAQMADTPVPATMPDYTDYNTYPPADFSTPDDTAAFYDTLAPYGNWVNLAGYGLCWQPIVYVRNHDWRPYNDRGRWLNTDCGWYWQSDYSWGWAAFHYGRWFRDPNAGWVWLPNRVWGPAWVSWRNSGEYAGWAPLPPSADFIPGVGFHFQNHAVSASFEFGLRRGLYTFIPMERLADYTPARYRVTGAQSAVLFQRTAVANNFITVNNQVVSRGVDPALVEARSGAPLRRVVIHDQAAGAGKGRIQPDRLGKEGDSFVLFRPQLPAASAKENGGAVAGPRPQTSSIINNSGAPKTTSMVPAAGSAGTRQVSGAPTVSVPDGGQKSRVQVYVRHDAPTAPAPAPASVGNPAVRGTQGETYPPNSMTVIGRRNVTDPSVQITSPRTFTVYQRPDLSGSVQPEQGNGLPFPERVNSNRGYGNGNQYNPGDGPVRPTPAASPAQSPLLLPTRSYGNNGGFSQPANNFTPAYTPRSTPYYNPQPQPLLLPPAHSEPAPVYHAPAPEPQRSAPAQSPQSSSPQQSGSSSGHR